jgi:hypothetical protein
LPTEACGAGLVRTAPKTDYRSRAVNGVDLAYLELVITAGIVDCEEPTAVRLAAQHIGEPRRAFKRRAVPPVTGERKGPEDEHQIVGANEGARIDAQAPTQSHEVLHGATQLRRTFGDAARLNDEDCLGVVERYQGLEVAGVVGLAEGRVNVFRSSHYRTKLARVLE